MVSNKQLTKTSKSTKILTEQLQNSDRLDIADLLQRQRDTIDNILQSIQEIPFDQATETYIYNLVEVSDMLLNGVCCDFLNVDFF